MKVLRTLGCVAGALLAASAAAWAAGVFTGYPQVGASGQPAVVGQNYLIPADTGLAQGINPATVVIPAGVLMPGYQTPRNLLDNGAMSIAQRGTGTVTCAANAAITSAAYTADRWGCSANVGSGAGRGQVVTSSPTPPTGFTNTVNVFRTSGALTQPVCLWQEIPTVESTALQGQVVTLSAQVAALAGLSADNGNVMSFVVISGTGNDQGFGTMTASPAITPAWTGITTVASVAMSVTTTFTRYVTTLTVPATATELAVGFCFTPTATGAGATDGFSVTGAQLEVAPSATQFEFHTVQQDLAKAQRYFYRLTETAAITPVAPCAAIDTTHTNCLVQFPVPMRTTPTMTYAAGFASPTSTTQATLGACTALASAATVASTVPNSLNVLVNCTATTIPAAGVASFLYSNNGTGTITASADF